MTPKVSALADQLTQGVTDRRAQAQKLYEWVSAHIRYVGIELGTGSFVPHDVDSIVANGYGDCKDHDVLLQALLKAKGIESQSILINSGNNYTMPDTASFATLDHVITYIPEFRLYLDSTAVVAPFGILPMAEYGKPMVVAAADGAGSGKTPLLAPRASPKITTRTVRSTYRQGMAFCPEQLPRRQPVPTTIFSAPLGPGHPGGGTESQAANVLTGLGYSDAEAGFTEDSPVALTPAAGVPSPARSRLPGAGRTPWQATAVSSCRADCAWWAYQAMGSWGLSIPVT